MSGGIDLAHGKEGPGGVEGGVVETVRRAGERARRVELFAITESLAGTLHPVSGQRD